MKSPLAMILVSAVHLCSGCAGEPERAENLILISLDTLRADRLECYGYDRPTSPNLSRFASQGTVFENAVAQSPWTLPSHASMLTGLLPHRCGVVTRDNRLSRDVPSLASILEEEGFLTSAIVNRYWLNPDMGFDHGFQAFEQVSEMRGNRGRGITNKAIAWLERNHDRAFFLFIHYFDVHSPYAPVKKFRNLLVRPYTGKANGSTAQLKKVRSEEITFSGEDLQYVSDLYDAEIRQLDFHLQRLFERLQELDLDESTCVIVTADHGEEFMEHGSVLHGQTMYGEVLRIPLLMKGPGIPRGERVEDLALLTDILPTALGRLGLSPPPRCDGLDLIREAAIGSGRLKHRLAFAAGDHFNEEPDILRMVRNRRFKLCYNRLTGDRELFDLVSDPLEKNNIVDAHHDIADELMRHLESFMTGRIEGEAASPRTEEELRVLEQLGY